MFGVTRFSGGVITFITITEEAKVKGRAVVRPMCGVPDESLKTAYNKCLRSASLSTHPG